MAETRMMVEFMTMGHTVRPFPKTTRSGKLLLSSSTGGHHILFNLTTTSQILIKIAQTVLSQKCPKPIKFSKIITEWNKFCRDKELVISKFNRWNWGGLKTHRGKMTRVNRLKVLPLT